MSETKSSAFSDLPRYKRKQKQRDLEQKRKQERDTYPPTSTFPNRTSAFKTVEEEQEAIQTTTEEKLKVYQ